MPVLPDNNSFVKIYAVFRSFSVLLTAHTFNVKVCHALLDLNSKAPFCVTETYYLLLAQLLILLV